MARRGSGHHVTPARGRGSDLPSIPATRTLRSPTNIALSFPHSVSALLKEAATLTTGGSLTTTTRGSRPGPGRLLPPSIRKTARAGSAAGGRALSTREELLQLRKKGISTFVLSMRYVMSFHLSSNVLS